MYYTRQFYGGGAEWDPRRKLYAVFFCEVCKHEEWVEIKQLNLFRFDQVRKCPKCNLLGKDDRVRALAARKILLEQERLKIQAEIEAIIKEIEITKEVTA